MTRVPMDPMALSVPTQTGGKQPKPGFDSALRNALSEGFDALGDARAKGNPAAPASKDPPALPSSTAEPGGLADPVEAAPAMPVRPTGGSTMIDLAALLGAGTRADIVTESPRSVPADAASTPRVPLPLPAIAEQPTQAGPDAITTDPERPSDTPPPRVSVEGRRAAEQRASLDAILAPRIEKRTPRADEPADQKGADERPVLPATTVAPQPLPDAVASLAAGLSQVRALLDPTARAIEAQPTEPAQRTVAPSTGDGPSTELVSEDSERRPMLRLALGVVKQDPAALPVPTVEVVRRETHFAPVAPPTIAAPPSSAEAVPAQAVEAPVVGAGAAPSVIAQVRDAIERAVPSAPAAVVPDGATEARALIPLRIVELSLQPATLGTVTVTMRLSSAGLKLSIAASVRDTAQRLADDRAELTDLVRRAGYGEADVTIELAPIGGGASVGDEGLGEDTRRNPRANPSQQAFDDDHPTAAT